MLQEKRNNPFFYVETVLEQRRLVPQSCSARIRAHYESLSPAERRVADYVLQSPDSVLSLTARELGKMADTSEATVVRFCQSLGYKGLPELRTDLMQDLFTAKREAYQGVTAEDGASELIRKVAYISIQALQQTITTLDPDAFQLAVSAIRRARTTYFFGSGGSSHVAKEVALKFLRMHRQAVAYSDYFSQVLGASMIGPDDVAVGLSYTGATRDTVEFLTAAGGTGATIIAITNFASSPIAEVADICLITGSAPGILGGEAGPARIAQLMVLDAIATALAINWPRDSGEV
jgi:RpiR family carbohydrate utilization transcriptional regulator